MPAPLEQGPGQDDLRGGSKLAESPSSPTSTASKRSLPTSAREDLRAPPVREIVVSSC
jgi:hypothetical protein